MNAAKYILPALLLSACGSGVDTNAEFVQDAEFTPYLEEFAARGYPTNISIEFGETAAIATCERPFLGNRHIVVSQFWKRIPAYVQEFVILHELGHCILGRPHDDSKPSIMNSDIAAITEEETRGEFRQVLLAELFGETAP